MRGAAHQFMKWIRRFPGDDPGNEACLVHSTSLYALILVVVSLTSLLVSLPSFATDPVLERIRKERVQERANGYLAEGQSALRKNHSIRAVRVLSDAIRLGAVPEGFKFRGEAYAHLGDTEAALRDFNSYLAMNPSDAQVHSSRGDIYFARRKFAKAIEDYSASLALDKTLMDAYRARGAAYIGCEEYERARSDLETVLRCNPRDGEALTNLAIACRLSGMRDAAKHFLDRALAAETEELWSQEIRGQLASIESRTDADRREGVSAFLSWSPEQPSSPPRRAEDVGGLASVSRSASQADSAPTAISPERPMGTLQPQRLSRISSRPSKVDISGRWDTTYMGHTVSLTVNQRDARLTGIFTIRNPAGKEDTYHFQGTFDGTNVVATHHGGNSFRGKLTNGRLVGVLSTGHGRSFNVDMSR